MAEQNILNGGRAELEQILGDISEHNAKKDRLEKLGVSVKDISKELETAQRSKNGEIDSKVKASIDAINDSYDKSIDADKEKIKNLSAEKDKAKMAGMKERISTETASLRAENDDLADQISEAFIHENIPKICNSPLFIAVFNAKKAFDYCIDILIMAVLFVCIPVALYLVPQVHDFVLLIYAIAMPLIVMITVKCVYRGVIVPHKDTIFAAQNTRNTIVDNRKRMRKIEKNIRRDKSEDMYGLEKFDTGINALHDDIARIESEKQAAFDDFEKTARQDIKAEIEARYEEKINTMKSELDKKQDEYDKLDDLVKKQRIYISSNYEAYMGKEFMNTDKLSELVSIMKSGSADTISQALAVYNNRY